MVRGARAGLIAVVLLGTIGGCTGDGGDDGPPPTTTTSVASIIALTPESPVVRLDPEVAGRPEMLELRIGPVGNPERSGFEVRVDLETSDDGASTYDLGRVSTFPPDAPGVFSLRLPDGAVRDLTGGGRKASVVLRLVSLGPDMPLPASLRLVVGGATLRPA